MHTNLLERVHAYWRKSRVYCFGDITLPRMSKTRWHASPDAHSALGAITTWTLAKCFHYTNQRPKLARLSMQESRREG